MILQAYIGVGGILMFCVLFYGLAQLVLEELTRTEVFANVSLGIVAALVWPVALPLALLYGVVLAFKIHIKKERI